METAVIPTAKRWPLRLIVFGIVTSLFAVLLVPGGVIGLMAPWLNASDAPTPGYTPEIHRWHEAEWGALMGVLFGGSTLAALWRPRSKPLLVQFVVLGVSALALVGALFDPSMLIFLALALLVGVAYPSPRTILDLSRTLPLSRPLMAISAAAAVLLAPGAWRNLQLQFADHSSEHGVQIHWAHGTILAIVLVLAGMLAATRRPGWRTLGTIAGLAWLYLGAAALRVPNHPGSWGVPGGTLALLGGAGHIVVALDVLARFGTRRLLAAGALGSLVWASAIIALHIVRPYDLERYGDTLSAYGVGPYAALFTIAFVALGVGTVALAICLWRAAQPSIAGRSGSALLVLAGIGLSLVGLFPMAADLASIEPAMKGDIPPTTSAIVHGLGGLSGIVFSIAGMLCLSFGLRRDERQGQWWGVSVGLSLLALALFLSGFFIDSPLAVPCCPPGSGGWIKAIAIRILFGAIVTWQSITALKLATFRGSDAGAG